MVARIDWEPMRRRASPRRLYVSRSSARRSEAIRLRRREIGGQHHKTRIVVMLGSLAPQDGRVVWVHVGARWDGTGAGWIGFGHESEGLLVARLETLGGLDGQAAEPTPSAEGHRSTIRQDGHRGDCGKHTIRTPSRSATSKMPGNSGDRSRAA